MSKFNLSGSDRSNLKEIKGSEGSQVGSFILSVYCRKRLNIFTLVVLSVATYLGKIYLYVGINSV